MTYVHKSGIHAGHQFLHFADIQVTYGETGIRFLCMQFHQFLVLQQSNLYTLRIDIYNQFFGQNPRFIRPVCTVR